MLKRNYLTPHKVLLDGVNRVILSKVVFVIRIIERERISWGGVCGSFLSILCNHIVMSVTIGQRK